MTETPVEITVHHHDDNYVTIRAFGSTHLTTILDVAGETLKDTLVDKIKDGEYELLIPTRKVGGQLNTVTAKLSESYRLYIRQARVDEKRTVAVVATSVQPSPRDG